MALDLRNEPELIAKYEELHREVWPEIKDSIRNAGILDMEIYRYENRLFMLMEVDDTFSFERKAEMDKQNTKVQEWEELMWNYQQALPGAKAGEKWVLLNKIFHLS